MITLESLKEQLKEKEALKAQTESVYGQLIGQIALLRDMIRKEEESLKKV